jgi:hypothetical protein
MTLYSDELISYTEEGRGGGEELILWYRRYPIVYFLLVTLLRKQFNTARDQSHVSKIYIDNHVLINVNLHPHSFACRKLEEILRTAGIHLLFQGVENCRSHSTFPFFVAQR